MFPFSSVVDSLPFSQSVSDTPCLYIVLSELRIILVISLVASFSPVIASGTILDTSCAIKPSTIVFVSSSIQLNLAGLSCFNLVVASKL